MVCKVFVTHLIAHCPAGSPGPAIVGDYRWRDTETPTNAKRAFGVDLALQWVA